MKYTGHGGNEIVERVIPLPSEARERIKGLKRVAITGRIARECIDITYGFKVYAFPIKVERGSAGWARVVTFVNE